MTVQRNTAAEQPKKQAMEEVTGPRKSMVRVRFPDRGSTLTYYNDRFDLHRGDIVFVEGAREGLRGCVVEVNYNFRIRLSDYKRVIAVADVRVEGKFYQMGSHFVTFDPQVLPAGKAASWYLPPKKAEEYVTGSDGATYPLEDWERVCVAPEIADRGRRYYVENRVVYLSLAGNEGYAIVEGSRPYEVEFLYHDGEIGELFCNCPCSFHCKHEAAVLLQLRELLGALETHYAAEYADTGYFAAVSRTALFEMVDQTQNPGTFLL